MTTDTTKAAKTAVPKTTALDDFVDAASRLTAQERATLEERGWIGPHQDDGDTAENWGYLCSHCNAVAIVFLGSKFRRQDETFSEELPPGSALNKLPWIQKHSEKFPRTLMSRETPICPDCRTALAFEGGAEKYLKPRLVRSLVAHREIEAENRRQIEDHRSSRRRVPIGNPGPGQIRIPT